MEARFAVSNFDEGARVRIGGVSVERCFVFVWAAISRSVISWALSSAISSRSRNDRYRPDGGTNDIGGMPPPWRNQRFPTAGDTPQAAAASSLDSPSAILSQNRRSLSRRIGGRPGDRIAGRPVTVVIHPAGRPIRTSMIKVLRRPVESALGAFIAVMD